jgi:hypothetical protein
LDNLKVKCRTTKNSNVHGNSPASKNTYTPKNAELGPKGAKLGKSIDMNNFISQGNPNHFGKKFDFGANGKERSGPSLVHSKKEDSAVSARTREIKNYKEKLENENFSLNDSSEKVKQAPKTSPPKQRVPNTKGLKIDTVISQSEKNEATQHVQNQISTAPQRPNYSNQNSNPGNESTKNQFPTKPGKSDQSSLNYLTQAGPGTSPLTNPEDQKNLVEKSLRDSFKDHFNNRIGFGRISYNKKAKDPTANPDAKPRKTDPGYKGAFCQYYLKEVRNAFQ